MNFIVSIDVSRRPHADSFETMISICIENVYNNNATIRFVITVIFIDEVNDKEV